MVVLPDVEDLSHSEAETAILNAGLRVGPTAVRTTNFTIPAGEVISQSPGAGEEVPGCSAVDLVISLGEVAYFEGFGDAAGAEPADWMDTGALSSMTENDALFKAYDVGGRIAFGTTSTLSDIHSHCTGAAYDAAAGFVLTGRMRMSASTGGIGVTFLSDYPKSDTYYRLRYHSSNAFHLAPHGTAALCGHIDSGVVPAANTWYCFKIQVTDTGSRTEIRPTSGPTPPPSPPAGRSTPGTGAPGG